MDKGDETKRLSEIRTPGQMAPTPLKGNIAWAQLCITRGTAGLFPHSHSLVYHQRGMIHKLFITSYIYIYIYLIFSQNSFFCLASLEHLQNHWLQFPGGHLSGSRPERAESEQKPKDTDNAVLRASAVTAEHARPECWKSHLQENTDLLKIKSD